MLSPATWLTGGWVFDVTGTERFRADLEIVDGIITTLEHVDPTTRSVRRDGRSLDVSNCTVLPGFIDAHSHVGILRLTGQAQLAPAVQAATTFAVLGSALDQGFTTLRDLGGVDGGLVEAVSRGLVRGPRLLPSGQILSQTGGHGDHRERFGGRSEQNPPTGCDINVPMLLVDGADTARRAAREQFHRGATQLKVFATGGLLSHGDPLDAPQFSLEELRAVVEVAQDRGSYVTAHAHTVRGLRRALKAGVRCLEHASDVDEETVVDIVQHGANVVATLTAQEVMRVEPEVFGLGPAKREEAARLREATARSLTDLRAAGVRIGCGADLIGEQQDRRGWEVALQAELFGGSVALQMVTRVNAEILGLDHMIGTVEVGKVADLVVFEGDPVTHPGSLRHQRPRYVLLDGGLVQDTSVGGGVCGRDNLSSW